MSVKVLSEEKVISFFSFMSSLSYSWSGSFRGGNLSQKQCVVMPLK